MSNAVSITWLGVIVSFIAVFALNMTYFSPKGFYTVWVRALGKDLQEQMNKSQSQNMAPAFTLVTIGIFVQAFVMDWIVQASAALYGHDVSFFGGLVGGAMVGVGLAAATSLGHRVFSGQGLRVWIIEVGADIIGLALMGAIFSFWH